MKRVQLWSCGGGRQSAGIAALISQGRMPKPDHVAMAALEWERKATYRYVCDYIRPALRKLGIPFTFVSRKKYATVDFWSGQDGRTPVLPVYSNQSGEKAKLTEYCSGEWKRDVVMRWAGEKDDWWERGVDNWIGISWDEKHRRRLPRRQWFAPVYPLLDWFPKCMGVSACFEAVVQMGWPEPPRSRCYHCPNQEDVEWAELDAKEWELACRRDEAVREIDPHAYLHRSLIPLRQVTLKPDESAGMFGGGCTAGFCY